MSEHSHQHHPHHAHQEKQGHQPAQPESGQARPSTGIGGKLSVPITAELVSFPTSLTVFTPDGRWKAVMTAWKDWYGVYQSIGAKVDGYERRATNNVWGQKTLGWVSAPATSVMLNRYQGSIAKSPNVPENPNNPTPGGGLGSYEQAMEFRSAHGELKLWAAGFLAISISVAGERTTPTGATLDIDRVASEIEVGTPSGMIRGIVGASCYADFALWG